MGNFATDFVRDLYDVRTFGTRNLKMSNLKSRIAEIYRFPYFWVAGNVAVTSVQFVQLWKDHVRNR